jgi:hypothetical protein
LGFPSRQYLTQVTSFDDLGDAMALCRSYVMVVQKIHSLIYPDLCPGAQQNKKKKLDSAMLGPQQARMKERDK